MFLRRKSRDRVIGLIGAYAVLIAGVVYTRANDVTPAVDTPIEVTPDYRKAEQADGGLSSRQQRSEIVC